ncbi:MAG: hypothetical protein AAGC43_15160 [Bacteroidota bacterium]
MTKQKSPVIPPKEVVIKLFYLGLVLLLPFIGFSQTGPGGVGSNDGSSSLRIWYNTTGGVVTTGATVDSLRNLAGVNAFDVGETGGQRPTLVAGAVNGYDEISFSGSNRLRTGLTLTPANFIVNEASSFVVNRADNTTQRSCVYTTDPLVGSTRFTNHIPWSGTVYFDIGTCCGSSARIQVGGLTGLTNYSYWSYDAHPTTGKQLYRNGSLLQSRANTTTYTSYASQRFNVGGNTSGTQGYVGDVAELIVFNARVNSAQRIIVENYLAAKFGLNSTSNDVYNEDDSANGNFDHDVAGIGRIDASNLHDDSQGTGIVRISDPTGLDNNEFLIWGHDNGALTLTNTTDVPSNTTSARLDRVWRVSEANTSGSSVDVDAIDIRMDMTGITGFSATNLPQLIVDTDNDGSFDDEFPISATAALGGDVYRFSGTTALSDNSRFTFGIGVTTVITNRKITYRVNKN